MSGQRHCYLAGPMSGYPEYNFPAFEAATNRLRDDGWKVTSPHEITQDVWGSWYGVRFDPKKDKAEWGDRIVEAMIIRDMESVVRCDAIVLLPGWENSRGANLELSIARQLGKQVFAYDGSLTEMNPSANETILQEAQRLVHGDRQAAYGHPIDDYTRTGRIIGAILGIPDVDPRLCTLIMAAVKISREVNKHKRDNLTDLAGYAECADLIAQRQGL